MKYEIIEKNPVARFWYKGNHTHPVRRTVLIIEQDDKLIRGYELREGNETRIAQKAPVKTYRKDKIAKGTSLRANNPIRKLYPNKSTLILKPLINIIEIGA